MLLQLVNSLLNKMEFDVIEKEYVTIKIGVEQWERNFRQRENEILKKQNELFTIRKKVHEWEHISHREQVNIVMSNGIIVKKIMNV